MKAIVIALMVLFAAAAVAGHVDPRYGDEVQRTAAGKIKRSEAVRNHFKLAHPCPSTKARRGPCPGWYIDHVVPLVCGGIDEIANLQWLPEDMWKAKSRWEQEVYCRR